jgi:H+/gluconate symporter-like permease
MSGWLMIPLLGVSWILAIALQSFGELVRLIKYRPKEISEDNAHKIRSKFYRICSIVERQQAERLIIIKEACGNTAVSMILSVLIIIIDKFMKSYCLKGTLLKTISTISIHDIFILILLLLIIISLLRMHFKHVERQYGWVNTIIEERQRD